MNWTDSEVLRHHLRELYEHIGSLLADLESGSYEYGNDGLEVDFAHLYYHLNNSWNGRTVKLLADDPVLQDDELARFRSDFPHDLKPTGN